MSSLRSVVESKRNFKIGRAEAIHIVVCVVNEQNTDETENFNRVRRVDFAKSKPGEVTEGFPVTNKRKVPKHLQELYEKSRNTSHKWAAEIS